ncbi:RING-H2 finger protein ATL51-like [Lolium rigidum]|uniref:RING-H2 finger protein ATL51-like n=1 Tax=Lolium rigidum TaxID=89674 RepID=UPI001F5C88B8|nr:RING-H2 finger protein ATL51-like [Lolium rigidum]
MPPPPENHPLPPPRPRPKPKPPKPKPPKPRPAAVRDQTHGVAVPLPPDPIACALHCSQACAFHSLCAPPPPPSRTTTLHLQSSRSRLPTPLIALSASVLAVSVLLLLVLLVCRVVRWRRRRQTATTQQHAPLNQHHAVDEEGGPIPLATAPADEQGSDDGDGMHHVWYIKTVGLDERAIAAITALVYDAEKCRGVGADGGCAVCLAEFRDGETLRLLPRCAHAFHRACIDTWLRAHVNCPLCRAPVKVASGNAAALAVNLDVAAGAEEEAGRDGEDTPTEDRALRRAASMLALPRRAWPDVDSLRAPASNSARQGEMGLAKITRVLKLSEALEMAGIGERRSASFSAAASLRLPGRSPQPAADDNTR